MKNMILAISGGADSCYLLHELLKKGILPVLAHFNHRLRCPESDEDEEFVRKLATQNNLIIEVGTADVTAYALKNKKSLEEAGRILRYEFLETVRKKHQADEILLAHHLNDNLETVLMNKMRGCHLRGRIGMRAKNKHLSRPLLSLPRSKIIASLQKNHLPYREDSSNQNTDYLRNWVRHELIPQLLKKNPHLLTKFQQNRANAIKEYNNLTQRAQKWLNSRLEIPVAEFLAEPPEFQSFLLAHIYEQTYGSTENLSRKQIQEILTLIKKNQTGKQKNLGPKLLIRTKYGQIKFGPQPDAKSQSVANLIQKIDPKTLPIAFDRVPQNILKQRSFKPGDRFQPSGMKGTKKLQDYFVDAKIPRENRQCIPIFTTLGDQIVAVGTRVDEKFRI